MSNIIVIFDTCDVVLSNLQQCTIVFMLYFTDLAVPASCRQIVHRAQTSCQLRTQTQVSCICRFSYLHSKHMFTSTYLYV